MRNKYGYFFQGPIMLVSEIHFAMKEQHYNRAVRRERLDFWVNRQQTPTAVLNILICNISSFVIVE